MNTYVILRRSGWRSPEELGAAAERSRQVGDQEMSDDIRWIRSYVLEEGGGSVGTVCIYQASSPEAIREHASRADLPVDEIIPVADVVLDAPCRAADHGHAGVVGVHQAYVTLADVAFGHRDDDDRRPAHELGQLVGSDVAPDLGGDCGPRLEAPDADEIRGVADD